MYGLLRNLRAPAKLSSLSFKDIVETLQQHLTPKPLLIAERFPFHRRNQLEGETVSAYLAELRKLSLYCEFGTNLDDSLRDRLVCGLHNELIQKRLLSEPSLSLAKATEIALAMEAAAKYKLELQGKKESEVNKLTKGNGKVNKMKGMSSRSLTVIDVVPVHTNQPSVSSGTKPAQNAGKWGTSNEFAVRERVQQPTSRGGPKEENRKLHSFEMADELDDDSLVGSLEVNNVNQAVGDVIWETPKVNSQTLTMELDTGSAVSTLPVQKYKEIFPNTPLVATEAILKTYSEEKIAPEGKLHVRVEYNNQVKDLTFYVVKTLGLALFGRDWLYQIQLDWKLLCAIAKELPTQDT